LNEGVEGLDEDPYKGFVEVYEVIEVPDE